MPSFHFQPGDILRCVRGTEAGSLTVGGLYPCLNCRASYEELSTVDNFGREHNWWLADRFVLADLVDLFPGIVPFCDGGHQTWAPELPRVPGFRWEHVSHAGQYSSVWAHSGGGGYFLLRVHESRPFLDGRDVIPGELSFMLVHGGAPDAIDRIISRRPPNNIRRATVVPLPLP